MSFLDIYDQHLESLPQVLQEGSHAVQYDKVSCSISMDQTYPTLLAQGYHSKYRS